MIRLIQLFVVLQNNLYVEFEYRFPIFSTLHTRKCYAGWVKLIGLLPFRNEAHNMYRIMENLNEICDEVIGYDSDSHDGSAEIFVKLGGRLISSLHPKTYFEGGEHEIRTSLLEEARARNCTHLVFLDCDEYFSSDFLLNARQIISQLLPGEKLALEWVNLWGDQEHYCTSGTWKPRYKDFVMRDDKTARYPYSLHHVSRTPNTTQQQEWKLLQRESGVVIHTQFVDQVSFQSKQVLCRISELLVTNKTAYDINKTYEVTSNLDGKIARIDESWKPRHPVKIEGDSNWRKSEVLRLIEKHGVKYFERLDIWSLAYMREIWHTEFFRRPRVAKYRTPLMLLKIVVYKVRVLLGYKFDE